MEPDPSETNQIRRLLEESRATYDTFHDQEFVVRPAIPILFFGDIKRYCGSALRVVTVGLNPSKSEFPEEDPFHRFAAARTMAAEKNGSKNALHLDALNTYFRTNPYKAWFSSLEPILNGLGSSFYDGPMSTALHTDLCSPLATDPTWSKLSEPQKSLLLRDGVRLWHSLLEILEPDVVLMSIAKRHLERIQFQSVAPFSAIWTLTLNRKQPYEVLGKPLKINSSKSSLLVFGRAAEKPFGTVSNENKRKMGTAIREWYDARAK